VYSGWVEMQQRVWMRLKWIKQIAMITPDGLLKISSTSIYDKCEYQLAGAQAVIIDGLGQKPDSGAQECAAPKLEIRFDPTLQLEGVAIVTFRLLSVDDIGPWTRALSRCSTPPPHLYGLVAVGGETRMLQADNKSSSPCP
jgi:hypothetical protein